MAEPIEIDVWQGEIAELEVDAIVVAASESLFMTAGAGAAVKRAGGDEIERAAVDQGPIRPGTAVATGGGSLAAPYVVHAVAVGHDRRADRDALANAIRAVLRFAEPLQLRRIAMAPLGIEHGAFAAAEAADIIVSTLLAEAPSTPIESIVLAAPHAAEVRAFSDALQAAAAGARSR
jgi:O-acetyl-ADP-ribose deacetylase (regulator of RNase III)